MATAGFPAIGSDRALLVRLAAGMTSNAVGFLASALTMPDGEAAIMLALPATQGASHNAAEIATRAISGFKADGQFLAFIDGKGGVEAASQGFSALGITEQTLSALVADVAREQDRVLKRLVPAAKSSYPAGIARLTDEPARHLLVVIDEGTEAGATQPAPASQTASEGDRPRATTAEGWRAADDSVSTTAGEHQHDRWYFSDANKAAEAAQGDGTTPVAPVQNETVPASQPVERNTTPVRFVWRTDAAGHFSAISPEFAAVVGEAAADVIGRRFKDVATTFGFDPSGEIAGLLERRDTWSGRSVAWPIAGSSLKVPVDLAALPVYDRNRTFEGFRGFGVARPADATEDHEKVGLALTPGWVASETPPAPAKTTHEATARPQEPPHAAPMTTGGQNPFHGEAPALTITPTPERRFSDKVIRLAEHRPAANDKGLSTLERSAFREIGERLKKDGVLGSEAGRGEAAPAKDPPAPATAQADNAIAMRQADGADAPAGQGEVIKPVERARPVAADIVEAAGAINTAEPATAVDTVKAEQAAEAAVTAEAAITVAPTESKHTSSEAETTAVVAEAIARPDEATTADEDDDSAALTEAQEAEDIADLTRLDGAGADEGGAAAEPVAEPAAPRSLLAFAPQDSDPVAEDNGQTQALNDIGDIKAAAAKVAGQRHAARRDEASKDDEEEDLARLEDDGDLTHPRDDAEEAVAPQPAPPLPTPRLVPPLQAGGFVPAAFATGEKEPDTSLLSRLPVPLLIHSGDVLHYANGEFLALTGYENLAALGAAGGLDALFAAPYASDSTADHADHKLRLRKANGEETPVDVVLRSVPWGEGKALMLVLNGSGETGQPITAATLGEAAQPDTAELKARVAEMRTIIDTATDGVVLIGRDGAIRSISRPAEALFGVDSDEVAGKPFASLFAIESQRAARDYLAGLSDHGVASVLNDGREVIGREAQGRFIPLFMTIGRLPGDSGYCAVVRDITQWKRAEEDLTQARAVAERASSQKTDFLARISHEIRTPLNAIIGFSELMVDEKFGPIANERYRDYLRDINRSGNHVLDLVNDLLDISKIEAGQQEMDYEAVSLNDALAEAVAMMQPQANRERVIIRSSFASRLPEVVADLRSIRQIALNILSNAVRYTQAGGQVIVSTAYETSGDVVMRVRDTGVGMTQAEIEHALKPFKQVNALKRGRGDGTGLGLPLTKAMVEANRAKFTINSTPGEGTLVEVAFPSTRVLAD